MKKCYISTKLINILFWQFKFHESALLYVANRIQIIHKPSLPEPNARLLNPNKNVASCVLQQSRRITHIIMCLGCLSMEQNPLCM